MLALVVPPYLVQQAIDHGVGAHRQGTLLMWGGAILGFGLFIAWLSIMRHRTMVLLRMESTFTTIRLVVRQATRLGNTLQGKLSTGEVVTVGSTDVGQIIRTLTISGPGVGGALAYAVVAAILLSVSVQLAVVVLVGAPLVTIVVGPLLGKLQGRQSAYRDLQGSLNSHVVDIVGGLRVLAGFGGAEKFARQYRRRSEELRTEGYRVGSISSWIQAMAVGLPTLYLALVTWLAARLVTEGSITVGQLVAVYGYVALLSVAISSLMEGGYDLIGGLVAASRVVKFLNLAPQSTGGGEQACPPALAEIRDPDTGLVLAAGQVSAIVSTDENDALALVEKMARFASSGITWDETSILDLDLDEFRKRVIVADNDAYLFSGPLRDVLTGNTERSDDEIMAALHAAVADDVVMGLANGLDTVLSLQGRSLSGGERQRLRLARALLADPDLLLMHEPTSAVDAHTEAEIAARIHEARAGRTTAIVASSPLLLAHADVVHFIDEGKLVASDTHARLLAAHREYRALVSRGDEDDHRPSTVNVSGEASS